MPHYVPDTLYIIFPNKIILYQFRRRRRQTYTQKKGAPFKVTLSCRMIDFILKLYTYANLSNKNEWEAIIFLSMPKI